MPLCVHFAPPPTGPTGWHSVIWSLAQAMTECEPAGGGGVCGFSAGQTHKIEGSNDRNQAARVGGGFRGTLPLPVCLFEAQHTTRERKQKYLENHFSNIIIIFKM